MVIRQNFPEETTLEIKPLTILHGNPNTHKSLNLQLLLALNHMRMLLNSGTTTLPIQRASISQKELKLRIEDKKEGWAVNWIWKHIKNVYKLTSVTFSFLQGKETFKLQLNSDTNEYEIISQPEFKEHYYISELDPISLLTYHFGLETDLKRQANDWKELFLKVRHVLNQLNHISYITPTDFYTETIETASPHNIRKGKETIIEDIIRNKENSLPFINRWLKEFNLAEEIQVNLSNVLGFSIIDIKAKINSNWYFLKDTGTSLRKTFYVLAQLSILNKKENHIIILDHPEFGLNFFNKQTVISFVNLINSIIETHPKTKVIIETWAGDRIHDIIKNTELEQMTAFYNFNTKGEKEG